MILYHVTTRDRLRSILTTGLDPSYSRGIRKSVWGVSRSAVTWAIVHVLSKPQHKGFDISDFVVIQFKLSRSQAQRYRRRIWFSRANVGCIPVAESDVVPVALYGSVKS